MKMMILDDVLMNIRLLEHALQGFGQVDSFQNPDQALENLWAAYITHQPYDLLFLDIVMPSVSGLDLLTQVVALGKNYPDRKKTRIVMVTSKGERDSVVLAIQRGASGYVLKPFQIDRIHEEINRLIAANADSEADRPGGPTFPGSSRAA